MSQCLLTWRYHVTLGVYGRCTHLLEDRCKVNMSHALIPGLDSQDILWVHSINQASIEYRISRVLLISNCLISGPKFLSVSIAERWFGNEVLFVASRMKKRRNVFSPYVDLSLPFWKDIYLYRSWDLCFVIQLQSAFLCLAVNTRTAIMLRFLLFGWSYVIEKPENCTFHRVSLLGNEMWWSSVAIWTIHTTFQTDGFLFLIRPSRCR